MGIRAFSSMALHAIAMDDEKHSEVPVAKNVKRHAGSLFLWRSLARQKQVAGAKQRASKCCLDVGHTDLTKGQAPPASTDDCSETSTTCSSQEEVRALQPLLWVSEGRFEGSTTRQFTLTIGRSSAHQRFGLVLKAKGDVISVAEDAMQFGVAQGDVVLSINGCHRLTEGKCRHILNNALKIDLSLLRVNFDAHSQNGKGFMSPIDQKSSWSYREGCRCIDLLAGSPLQALPAGPQDHFTIQIHRASRHQKFGLNLTSVNKDVTGRNLTSEIYCTEDLPHLDLKMGDQVLSINGCTVRNVTECCSILDTCMNVELLVKRGCKVTIEQSPDVSEESVEEDWQVLDDQDEPALCVPKRSLL